MDIKFPQREDPFRKTFITAIISTAVALIIGLFLGFCLGSLFGTNQEMLNTTNYTDGMAAARSVFTDPDQMDSYINTAQTFRTMEGLRVYSGKDQEHTLVWYDGAYHDPESLFDEDVLKSLRELMNTDEALYGITDSMGDPMENIRMFNIAVREGIVYYYLYYDEAGYIGIAFDYSGQTLTNQGDAALPLTKTSDGEDGYYQWFITYHIEE